MDSIIWNIRGIGNDISVGRVNLLVKSHSIQFLAILEPKIKTRHLDTLCRRLGFDKAIANIDDHAHIWFFWRDPFDFITLQSDDQQLTLSQVNLSLPAFHITFVYAKCTPSERISVWHSLRLIHARIQGPWLVAGDFNCILNAEEKLGGNATNMVAI